jgi:hypothetical protein
VAATGPVCWLQLATTIRVAEDVRALWRAMGKRVPARRERPNGQLAELLVDLLGVWVCIVQTLPAVVLPSAVPLL